MDMQHTSPFKIGQDAEAKSHVDGYRGAWFRCKVKNIKMRGGELWCALEYFDYPGEKVRWTKVYQKDPVDKKKLQLMMRPCFPHFYCECDIPNYQNHSQMDVIINNEWEVGNLVDLWYDSCFWSGKIAAVFANNKVKVDLLQPPVGEGGSYDGDCKDLRPTLVWSVKSGWSVPVCENRKDFNPCVHLISALKSDPDPALHMNTSAQYKNFPWKGLLLQNSDSVAKVVPDIKSEEERDLQRFHSHPDYEKKVVDIVMTKGISYGVDHPSGTCCNLTELAQLLTGLDGSKQFMSCGQQNLRLGKTKCDLTASTNGKGISHNALCQSWQPGRDDSQEFGTSCVYDGAGAPKQDSHVTGTTLDADSCRFHGNPIIVENSFHHMDRTDCDQSMTNDSLSVKERNTVSLSTYKKEQARVIVERAKSFCHGRGRLKRKTPGGEDNSLFSLDMDSRFDMSSNSKEAALSVLSKRIGRNKNSESSSCMNVDEIESSVMALEELANKVKWLRGVMQFGFKQWSTMTEVTWQLSEKQMANKEASGQ